MQALKGRIAARPPDTVEEDVALSHRGHKLVWLETRQQHAIVGGSQSIGGERTIQALPKQGIHIRAQLELNEYELTVLHLACNARKDLIELRQIFEE